MNTNERYAAPQTNSLIFKERKFAVHKMYSIPGTFPQHPTGNTPRLYFGESYHSPLTPKKRNKKNKKKHIRKNILKVAGVRWRGGRKGNTD